MADGFQPVLAPSQGEEGPLFSLTRPLAFLVDGDNATASYVDSILEEAARYGTVVIRRVYGDWTSPHLQTWKKVLQKHAFAPIQQFANVSGKNATDSALIIDAMDILHGHIVQGFCIVSSDSDYTRLATRIRESGAIVIGMGRATTAPSFRNACNVFVTVENLAREPSPQATERREGTSAQSSRSRTRRSRASPSPSGRSPVEDALPLLRKAFDGVVREDGRVHLAELGSVLVKLDPAFDSRTYGCPKLVNLVDALPQVFRVERPKGNLPGSIYVSLSYQQASVTAP